MQATPSAGLIDIVESDVVVVVAAAQTKREQVHDWGSEMTTTTPKPRRGDKGSTNA